MKMKNLRKPDTVSMGACLIYPRAGHHLWHFVKYEHDIARCNLIWFSQSDSWQVEVFSINYVEYKIH